MCNLYTQTDHKSPWSLKFTMRREILFFFYFLHETYSDKLYRHIIIHIGNVRFAVVVHLSSFLFILLHCLEYTNIIITDILYWPRSLCSLPAILGFATDKINTLKNIKKQKWTKKKIEFPFHFHFCLALF